MFVPKVNAKKELKENIFRQSAKYLKDDKCKSPHLVQKQCPILNHGSQSIFFNTVMREEVKGQKGKYYLSTPGPRWIKGRSCYLTDKLLSSA